MVFIIFKDFEIPDSVYDSLKVPSLDNFKTRNIKQFYSYKSNSDFRPIRNGFSDFEKLRHLEMQVDHLEGTNFVQVKPNSLQN